MTSPAQAYQIDQIHDDFAEDVRNGLRKKQKEISCRYFYDARGSELFEKITELEEYYPTRTEIELLEKYSPEIARIAGTGTALIEFGSGSSRKTRILIEALKNISAYVPIDISDAALAEAEERLNGRYPRLVILPLHADFNQHMELPDVVSRNKRLGFFPGSTIGNFSHDEARHFLKRAAKLLGSGSGLVIGVDLKKSTDILIPAYDDAKGVTAEFNLNLLERINRELGGNFDLTAFAHKPTYNLQEGRIEIFIESLKNQVVTISEEEFTFAKGELIHTENSHKFTVEEFIAIASGAGWSSVRVWQDCNKLFSVHYLIAS